MAGRCFYTIIFEAGGRWNWGGDLGGFGKGGFAQVRGEDQDERGGEAL